MRVNKFALWSTVYIDLSKYTLESVEPKQAWMPKNKKAREIPINDELRKILVDQRMRVKCRFVIKKTNGKSYDRGLWLNFKRFARRLLAGRRSNN